MTSISQQVNKDKLDQDEFWHAIKDAQTFDDLVIILIKHYSGLQDSRGFRALFKKCMRFVGNGFALNEDLALWRKVLAAVADNDSIVFVFVSGLTVEFRQDRGGKVRMHISVAGEGNG
jgi:hypothetical protein